MLDQEQPVNPDPQVPNPNVPSATEQPSPTSPPLATGGNNPGQTLAIIGLVMAFLPLQLIGLILSIIAKVKARKGTSTNVIAIIGIVLNAIFGLIGAGIAVAIGLAALSGVQNAATADAFLSAVQSGDIDKAASYTDEPNDAATKTFLKDAATKVGTDHKQTDTKSKGSLYGFAYELNGGSSKYARVTISNKDGKRYVYELVYGNDKIDATPREQQSFSATTQSSEPSLLKEGGESSPTVAKQCIEKSDVVGLPGSINTTPVEPNVVEWETYFEPNTATFAYPLAAGPDLDALAVFIKSQSGKNFTVEVRGGVAMDRATSDATNLANSRAQKIKQELTNRGVSGSLITVTTPHTFNSDYNMGGDEIARTAQLDVVSGC